jgi:mannosyl-3-phosphoglycerate phosphatase
LRQTHTILFLAVDDLIPVAGEPTAGLDELTAALDHEGIPTVWVTSRTRLQLDGPRRKLGHTHPFIGEDGCGVYLPQDYFHLRPQSVQARQRGTPTVRLGRFTCVAVAEQQPAAESALELLSTETKVPVVPLKTLSPRELAQNLGLPLRDAELARQRDFDELFFFAGGIEEDIERFEAAGRRRNVQLRRQGPFHSLAVSASLKSCIRELSHLYDRAVRSHALTIGVGTSDNQNEMRSACHRFVLMAEEQEEGMKNSARVSYIPAKAPDKWGRLLDLIASRKL